MTGKPSIRLVSRLAFACILLLTWSFVDDILRLSEDHPRSLAEDTLLVASDSVREAMLSLLAIHEDEPRTLFERDADGRSGTTFEQLQASLDNFHRESLLRDVQAPSGPRSTKGRHFADIDLCRSLAGKRITMIGGEHIYRLHVLLLQQRERAEKKQFPCPYHEFCTHHHICSSDRHVRDEAPLPRYIKPPTTQKLVETGSAAVNYIVSDTLFSAQDESSWEYALPFVDPMTGVRLRETYWLAAARKANVVVLGRGPLSAPGQTYTGNWSFFHHVPDYLDISRASFAGEYKHHDDDQTVPHALQVLNAAVHLTVSRFLPDLFQLLQSIRRDVRPGRQKRLIWPSTWYRLPGRGAARTTLLGPYNVRSTLHDAIHFPNRRSSVEHVLALHLSTVIHADATQTALGEDPWTLLFNAQVYLENMVLGELLPRYGIVFLPLDVPWVEGAQTRRNRPGYPHGAKDVELDRMAAVGEAFLTGIEYVLGYLE